MNIFIHVYIVNLPLMKMKFETFATIEGYIDMLNGISKVFSQEHFV